MAHPASVMRHEKRRHRIITVSLLGAALGGSLLVTNERALFIPIGRPNLSATAAAFAAMFAPLYPVRALATDAIAPLEPFDVFADSRDVSRRLSEAFGDFSEPTGTDPDGITPFGSQALSPVELASAAAPGAETAAPSPTGDSAVPVIVTPLGGSPRGLAPLSPVTAPGFSPSDLAAAAAPPVPQSSTAVPEPSSWMMLFAGFGAIGFILRSRRRRAEDAATIGG